jgi:HAD superfamily hydrolase (TIGR01509 family)
MPARLAALLLDLDGTLVDSERQTAEGMARALAAGQDIVIDQADRDFIIGRSWVAIDAHLRARYPRLAWTRAELIEATAAEREGVFAEQGLDILPGARETIDRFADGGVPLALVTGSSRVEAEQMLHALGRRARFAHVVAAEDVPRSKPAPDGYLLAMRALGVPADGCLVLEDSAAGIAAGVEAGARVVGVAAGNFHGQDHGAAHARIATLHDLSDALLAQLFAGGAP